MVVQINHDGSVVNETDRDLGGLNGHPIEPHTLAVNNQLFCKQIERLGSLQEFLYQEAVPFTAVGLGSLRGLHFDKNGRPPTVEEWSMVESQTQEIFQSLTPALRRKFLMGGTSWMLAWLPAQFLILAALSLAVAVVTMDATDWPEYILFFPYLVWIASLGIMGAFAFIGMNALSIQDDITFDLTNMRLMSLRVSLGALFAVIITLPFGFPQFQQFCKVVWKPSVFYDPQKPFLIEQVVFLVLPFVLGFSTSLVILILNQMLDAAQTFFGRKSGTSALMSTANATSGGKLLDSKPHQTAPRHMAEAAGKTSVASIEGKTLSRGRSGH
ncbi:hypothetical protein [Rhizobium ruizarguesonis]|uniref:hypothetical protein n=1 Tax=Rhizobium ruizarguesonis TaxID=2081791 RepID=UPI00102F83F5|nr:hypothetical protein [Rhizobium ruizarguesonis]NKL44906.1 hypothetical protein [Rhizobium leguminosarum bv. viciae]TBE09288.1 hypothetical protein ELH12_26195 [Rhizobium ruizarguesonis]TBE80445.1 hypothetical protein ELH01_25995 [Rhizobium ruizarguesonis]TBE90100.1 hypothetical protein ELG99_26180 [Rhizobium ruizarguesonis]